MECKEAYDIVHTKREKSVLTVSVPKNTSDDWLYKDFKISKLLYEVKKDIPYKIQRLLWSE